MALTQLKITKFFKPAKLPDWIKQLRKARHLAKANEEKKISSSSKSKKSAPAVLTAKATPPKYTPPHKRNPSQTKPTPQATAQKRPSAPTPKKPDSTKSKKPEQPQHHEPNNQAMLDLLAASTSPKFNFPKEKRPSFRSLFPGTSKPKVTMLHGTPTIDKGLFNSLLTSRIAAAHTLLRKAKLDRPRLPKSFVSSQIHLIQHSLKPPKKTKKEVSSPPKDKKDKARHAESNQAEPSDKKKKQTTFVPASSSDDNSTSEQILSPDEITTAKLRASDIQTPRTQDLHDLVASIRARRTICQQAQILQHFPDRSAAITLFKDCLRAVNLDDNQLIIVPFAINNASQCTIEYLFNSYDEATRMYAISRLTSVVASATQI